MNEETFRGLCATECRRYPHLPALRSIAAVGAYDAEIGGDKIDSQRLTDCLTYLLKSGILIAPDFEIDIVNFREGRDFLLEDKKYDLTFVSYIISGTCGGLPYFWPKENRQRSEQDLIITISRHNDTYYWADRLERAETKIAVTFGGHVEVTAQSLARDDFPVLIPSPSQECCGNLAPKHKISPLYPTLKNIDLPQGWFGFAAQRDYLAATAASLAPSTCLGQQALKAISPALSNNPPWPAPSP